MSPRYAAASAYRVIFVVFPLCPCVLSAPSGGSNSSGGDTRANAIIVVIAVFSLVIVLSLGASLAFRFPSFLPTILRHVRQAMDHPFSSRAHHELKMRFFTAGRLSSGSEASTTITNPAPSHTSARPVSFTTQGREISSPLSIIFENHSPPAINQSSQTSEGRTPDTPRASIESMPRDNVDTLDTLATTHTEDLAAIPPVTNVAQLPGDMNGDDTPSHDHPPIPEVAPLPQSPTPSTRPPTYYTDASRDSMCTLPVYQENEENQQRRTWSTRPRSATIARGRRGRSLPRPPLPPPLLSPPPSSYSFKS